MTDMPDRIEELADRVAEPITEDDDLDRRLARLRWLSEKIERGVATEEEAGEFKREYARVVGDMNEALHPIVDAYTAAVTSMTGTLAEPMAELAESFSFSPSEQK